MLFKEFLSETGAGAVGGGATAAHSVAGFRGSLFGGGNKKKKKKKSSMIRRMKGGPVGNAYSFKFFSEAAEDRSFDPADVISKLKTAAKAASKHGDDTTAFALEDENGNLVKIWVAEDQADSFQDALEAALARSDEDEDDENDKLEIAEVLWKLRNDFDIIDVEWGNIPEDQEEATTAPAAGAEAGAAPGGGAEGAAPAEGEGAPAEGEGEGEGEMSAEEPIEGEGEGGEEDAQSALQQVIDMMKSDAAAKKAEAEAEIARAQAEQAKYAAQAAEQKVKQEEDVLDMEAYYDAEKEQKQEAERLAKLAKYRHELAKDKGVGLGAGKEPEVEIEPGAEADIEVEPGAEADVEAAPEEEETLQRKPKKIRYARQEDLGDLIIRALRGDE